MHWVTIGAGIYLTIGILVAWIMYYTPYRDFGLFWIALGWPLWIPAFF
jgi:hypothetical protein